MGESKLDGRQLQFGRLVRKSDLRGMVDLASHSGPIAHLSTDAPDQVDALELSRKQSAGIGLQVLCQLLEESPFQGIKRRLGTGPKYPFPHRRKARNVIDAHQQPSVSARSRTVATESAGNGR